MANHLRILVIDDDPVMRELLQALFDLAGHTVEAHESGIAALARLEASADNPFDVVLTDLHMPFLQGRELAQELLDRRPPSTVVLGMSGSFPSADEIELLDVFLQKPFTTEQFEEAVRSAQVQKHPLPSSSISESATTTEAPLDDSIFSRLAGTLPAAQLRALYDLTLDDVTTRAARIQAALAASDFEAVSREAHAVKGGTGMVGATELYRLATAIEHSPHSHQHSGDFSLAIERLRRILDERLPGSR